MLGHTLLNRWWILSHGYPSEEIRRPFSHWSMRHDWHISSSVLYTRAYFSADDGFWGVAIFWRWSDFLFTLEHETWLAYFIWCTLHRGIFLSRWWILGHSHFSEVIRFSFHVGVRDMTGWFPWCDYRSIALSLYSRIFDWLYHGAHLWELYWFLSISEIALYWGITLSLVINLRDTSLHLGMIM